MADKLRVAVIGLGWPGQEHLKGYKLLSEVDVVALCDLRADLLAEWAGTHRVPATYTDHREMLAQAKPDAVSVCVPNDLHKPVSIDCLKAGAHVLCEKPPALSAGEAAAMAAAAKQAGRLLMYAMVMRFASAAQLVKSYVAAGELGDIYFGDAAYVRRSFIPVGAEGWFIKKTRSGGGALIDIGVHALDRVWWLMGNPKPTAVMGASYTKFAHLVPKGVKYDVDDAAFAVVRFANDATLMLQATWALHLPGRSYAAIAGTKGGATLDPLTIYTTRNGVQHDTRPLVESNNAMVAEAAHFVECIVKGQPCQAPAEQGITLMKMLDAVYKSSATGREVRIRD